MLVLPAGPVRVRHVGVPHLRSGRAPLDGEPHHRVRLVPHRQPRPLPDWRRGDVDPPRLQRRAPSRRPPRRRAEIRDHPVQVPHGHALVHHAVHARVHGGRADERGRARLCHRGDRPRAGHALDVHQQHHPGHDEASQDQQVQGAAVRGDAALLRREPRLDASRHAGLALLGAGDEVQPATQDVPRHGLLQGASGDAADGPALRGVHAHRHQARLLPPAEAAERAGHARHLPHLHPGDLARDRSGRLQRGPRVGQDVLHPGRAHQLRAEDGLGRREGGAWAVDERGGHLDPVVPRRHGHRRAALRSDLPLRLHAPPDHEEVRGHAALRSRVRGGLPGVPPPAAGLGPRRLGCLQRRLGRGDGLGRGAGVRRRELGKRVRSRQGGGHQHARQHSLRPEDAAAKAAGAGRARARREWQAQAYACAAAAGQPSPPLLQPGQELQRQLAPHRVRAAAARSRPQRLAPDLHEQPLGRLGAPRRLREQHPDVPRRL
mmetsp:Transcript_17485/g.52572  ORF Transcript_17485/g.52572 Transcript_17485/m.52572 type:complete len:490 (-) Transcript_17485:181-1650(-)